MKTYFFAATFSIFFFTQVSGQALTMVLRGNVGAGMSYYTLDYSGGSIFYSPGGGVGLEAGMQLELLKNLNLGVTFGYQHHLALQAETSTFYTNKTSFTFNRKYVSIATTKYFKISDKVLQNAITGAGFSYNSPGALIRTENNKNLGRSEYDNRFAVFFEGGLGFKASDTWSVNPTLRYRLLKFDAISFSEGEVVDLPTHLQRLNANGLEVGVTLIKKI